MTIPPQAVQEVTFIREDRIHGAGELARRAAGVLAIYARHSRADTVGQFLEELDYLGALLAGARPSMAIIQRVVVSLIKAVHMRRAEEGEAFSPRDVTVRLASEFQENYRRASSEASTAAARTINGLSRVLTHSRSRTVMEALTRWAAPSRRVVITESRPLLEGIAAAKLLAEAGLDVTIITDAQAGLFVSEVEAVLVGADSVLRDGDVVNKAGTLLLALAAHRYHVPFYVVCETLKLCISPGKEHPPLEEKDWREVTAEEMPRLRVRNIYFDVTPSDLIAGFITEMGLLTPAEVAQKIIQEEKDFLPWVEHLMNIRDQ